MTQAIRPALSLLAACALTGAAWAAPRARPPEAAPAPMAAPAAQELSTAEIVRRANQFLNGISSLSTEFAQTNPDGRRVAGRFYLQRPGKLRFDYDPPVALEIVSDGSGVTVRDRKLKTQNTYPIGQTPLVFLLQDNIDLARDLKLTGVARTAQGTYVAFDSPSTFNGTSKVALFFDDTVTRLLQWRIIDSQNQQTAVTLNVLDRTPIDDPRVFDAKFQSQR